jgi:hypothetical protein
MVEKRRGCLELKDRLRQRMSAGESSECVGVCKNRSSINFNQPQLRRGEYNRGMREQGES